MGITEMVVIIVVISVGFAALATYWGIRFEERKLALKAGEGDVPRLEQILMANQAEMARLRERVQVLEKLATDDDRRLSGEIERLRAAEARG